jgi:hypothetical protein
LTRFTTVIDTNPATMSPEPRRIATPTPMIIIAGRAGMTIARYSIARAELSAGNPRSTTSRLPPTAAAIPTIPTSTAPTTNA